MFQLSVEVGGLAMAIRWWSWEMQLRSLIDD